jgi:hypothetical protein
MQMYGEVQVQHHHSWPNHLMGASRQFHASAILPLQTEPQEPNGHEAGWAPELICMLQRKEKNYPTKGVKLQWSSP